MSTSDSKGKGRAENDERTPLLDTSSSYHGSVSSHALYSGELYEGTRGPRRSLVARLLTALAYVAIIALIAFIIFATIVWSTLKRAPALRHSPDQVVTHATQWRTTSIDLIGVSAGNINIEIHGELGVDFDELLGLDSPDGSAITWARRTAGHWLVSAVKRVRISSTNISTYDHDGTFLLNCVTTDTTIHIPGNSRKGRVQMEPLTIPLRITPTSNSSDLVRFANATWIRETANLRVEVPRAVVQVVGQPWWLPLDRVDLGNISKSLRLNIPRIPSEFPQPGSPLQLSNILHLGAYAIAMKRKNKSSGIVFSALANLLLPFHTSSISPVHIPSKFPILSFLVSLIENPNITSSVPFATISTIPKLNTSSSLASLAFPISGSVLPMTPRTVGPLSQLVSNYLAARPTLIKIQSSGHSTGSAIPPTFVNFPAPAERPEVLRGVTIKNMRIGTTRSGEELTASGTIIATFVLPSGVDGLIGVLDIRKLWPDTLVYDGLPPRESPNTFFVNSSRTDADKRPVPPLPDPLPERAFARIRTPDWLIAQMLPEAINRRDVLTGKERSRQVTAEIVDAPLEVLPGRDAQFQAFIRKVILSHGTGALAGVRGTSAVALRIDGFPLPRNPKDNSKVDNANIDEDDQQDIELDGLTFEGSFFIGRKTMLSWAKSKWHWLQDA